MADVVMDNRVLSMVDCHGPGSAGKMPEGPQ